MTDTITTPRALLEQALWTLEDIFGKNKIDVGVINALRSALEQPQDDPFAPALYTGQPIPEIERRNKETVRLADPQDPVKTWGDAYGDGTVYRGVRSKDSSIKTIDLTVHEYKTLWYAATSEIEKLQQRIAELKAALEQPQQEPLADALRLLRTAIQTGHPEYGPADWIDMIDTALEGPQQESDLYAVFRYAREADTPLLRHCLELIEGEWPADDPAAGPLMVKLRQRLGVQP